MWSARLVGVIGLSQAVFEERLPTTRIPHLGPWADIGMEAAPADTLPILRLTPGVDRVLVRVRGDVGGYEAMDASLMNLGSS